MTENGAGIRVNQELGLRHEQRLYATEVLDNMPGFMDFYKREGERNYNPDQADEWIFTGLSGVGKTVMAEQFRRLVEKSRTRARRMGRSQVRTKDDRRRTNPGKDPLARVYSWDTSLRAFVDSDPKKVWGDLAIDDYSEGGENMSMGLHRFKTLTASRRPDEAITLIVTLPLFTGARGGALVLNVVNDRNLKVVASTADEKVIENAGIIRDALRLNKEAFLEALRQQGAIIDVDLSDEQFAKLQHMMGTRASIIKHEEDLTPRILEEEADMRKWWERERKGKKGNLYQDEVIPDFDEETLSSDLILRERVKPIYYDYYLGKRLGLPRSKYLITRNIYLPRFNFYLSDLLAESEDFSVNL